MSYLVSLVQYFRTNCPAHPGYSIFSCIESIEIRINMDTGYSRILMMLVLLLRIVVTRNGNSNFITLCSNYAFH